MLAFAYFLSDGSHCSDFRHDDAQGRHQGLRRVQRRVHQGVRCVKDGVAHDTGRQASIWRLCPDPMMVCFYRYVPARCNLVSTVCRLFAGVLAAGAVSIKTSVWDNVVQGFVRIATRARTKHQRSTNRRTADRPTEHERYNATGTAVEASSSSGREEDLKVVCGHQPRWTDSARRRMRHKPAGLCDPQQNQLVAGSHGQLVCVVCVVCVRARVRACVRACVGAAMKEKCIHTHQIRRHRNHTEPAQYAEHQTFHPSPESPALTPAEAT